MVADARERPGRGRFADLLRRHRIAAALSQERLAEKAGISVRAVSDLERGVKTRPHLQTVALLADALGLSPNARIDFAEAARPASRVGSAAGAAHAPILTATNSLIGRETESAALHQLLRRDDVKLVTLVGPGGVGKTRLAIEVARELVNEFSHVWIVPLAALDDVRLVVSAVAVALGVREIGAQPIEDLVAGYLADRRALLVLDNFEHVLVAAAFVAKLLAVCPNLRLLTTSRHPLRVTGEHVASVPPLVLPGLSAPSGAENFEVNPAVRLFVDRARAVYPRFELTDEIAPAVAAICHRLDGLPLAIELAAARIRHATPQELLRRLDRSLPLLVGGPTDMAERHQTMRATIGWSYHLLTGDEQTLFRRAAVFPGGFTLGDLASVSAAGNAYPGDPFEAVAALVDHSLLRRYDAGDGTSRYDFLEPIREYGEEMLRGSSEEAQARQAHAMHYVALAESLRPRIEGPEGSEVLARFDMELPNMRAALAWAAEAREAETLQRLCLALWKHWWVRRHISESQVWLDAALSLPEVKPVYECELRYVSGSFALGRGDLTAVRRHAEAGLALAEANGDAFWRQAQMMLLGHTMRAAGRPKEAIDLYERALQIVTELLSEKPFASHVLAFLSASLSATFYAVEDLEQANAKAEEALAIWRDRGDPWGVGIALLNLGAIAAARGDFEQAAEHYGDAICHNIESGDPWGIAEGLNGLVHAATHYDLGELTARLLGARDRLEPDAEQPTPAAITRDRINTAPPISDSAGDAAFTRGIDEGRQLSNAEVGELTQLAVASVRARAGALTQTLPRASSGGVLTTRESQVLRLVAEGRTDQAIADELYLARRTVTSHLTSIFNKLGVENRAAATAHAIRSGLI